jgi:hypothetical protein
MGRYVSFDAVRQRLIGKVRFTDDEDNENEMNLGLAKRLIDQAEGDVEFDLSPRYEVPFRPVGGGDFDDLPDRPTKQVLKNMCEMASVMLILDYDFGSGSTTNAENYYKSLKKRYDRSHDRLLAKRKDGASDGQGYLYPPLPGLELAWHNAEADDGFMGQVLTTSQGDGGYPAGQVNDPSETFWNAELDEL